MNRRTIELWTIAACVAGAGVVFNGSAVALQLITEKEASLPPAQISGQRSISRGPKIVVVSPQPAAGTMHSPIDLKIRFESYNGAEIDVETVLVTYLKQPAVDLTQRLKPFIAAAGIEVKDTEVPIGTHWVRVEVHDSYGHATSSEFSFTISP